MKAIKTVPRKERLLYLFLVGIIILPTVSVFLYFRIEKYVESDQYDVLSFCESIPEPVFSVPEGIYEQPFELEITAPSDYEIYFTTDGSMPTTRSHRYKKRINVNPNKNLNRNILHISTSLLWRPPYGKQPHSTVIRARCFKAGAGYGKTKNIIYSAPDIKQHQGFQVVHILIEPDSLFSQERGIYVLGEKYYSKRAITEIEQQHALRWFEYPANYHQRGQQWSRPAEFILKDASGKTLHEQSVRLRIHGLSTRALPIKTLRVTADSNRGDSVISYRFFDDLPYENFKTILLRSSGNDQVRTMFRDAMVQQMAKGLGLSFQEYAPAVLYINGNYWGIHNIRERLCEYYLANKYGAAMEKINMLEYNGAVGKFELQYGDDQSLQSFNELINYMQKNSTADENVYQYVSSQIDIDNFIDYVIVQTFFANADWGDNNMRLYKIEEQTYEMKQKNIEACKWRWLLADFDLSMFSEPANMFDHLHQNGHISITTLFFGLLKNDEFKEKFLNRYEYIIRNLLTTSYMLQHVEDFEERYQHEMARHIARWRYPGLFHIWRRNVDEMKTFMRERPEIVLKQLEGL